MTSVFSSITSLFMSVISWFLSIFGINIYNNGLDDVNFDAVKEIIFSSEFVSENIGSGSYNILQGGCTDGKYAYYCSNDPYTNKCSISKFSIETFDEVTRVNAVSVDHGNDITYNKNKDCLVVCHNSPNRTLVSFVDKKTLEITETFEIPLEIYSITHNHKTNEYAVGISYTFDFAILDKDFNVIERITGVTPEKSKTKQGMDSDDKYLYFLLSGPNAISVYDWNGNHYGIYEMKDSATNYESENIFHINDDLYIGYNHKSGKVYKTNIEALYE